MVEILLSCVLLIAAIALAPWPSLVIHDHTIDGLFLTLTGSMLTLLFLFNFIWQLRFQGAKEVTIIRHAWQHWTCAVNAVFSKGGRDMRKIPPTISIPLVMGVVLLLILAFPCSLYANDHHERSEEHTSELQSLTNLVCRLLLEKKKKRQDR